MVLFLASFKDITNTKMAAMNTNEDFDSGRFYYEVSTWLFQERKWENLIQLSFVLTFEVGLLMIYGCAL